MRKIKEVLRLKKGCCLSSRAIAHSCGIARSTVADYLRLAEAAGLTWPFAEDLDDAALESLLFPPPSVLPAPRAHLITITGASYRALQRPKRCSRRSSREPQTNG